MTNKPSPEKSARPPPNFVLSSTPGVHAMNEPPVSMNESPSSVLCKTVPGCAGEKAISPPLSVEYSPTKSDSPPVNLRMRALKKPPSSLAFVSMPESIHAIEPPSAMNCSPGPSRTRNCP